MSEHQAVAEYIEKIQQWRKVAPDQVRLYTGMARALELAALSPADRTLAVRLLDYLTDVDFRFKAEQGVQLLMNFGPVLSGVVTFHICLWTYRQSFLMSAGGGVVILSVVYALLNRLSRWRWRRWMERVVRIPRRHVADACSAQADFDRVRVILERLGATDDHPLPSVLDSVLEPVASFSR